MFRPLSSYPQVLKMLIQTYKRLLHCAIPQRLQNKKYALYIYIKHQYLGVYTHTHTTTSFRKPRIPHRLLHVSFQAITANVVSELYDTVQGASSAYRRNFSMCFVICVFVFLFLYVLVVTV